MPEAPRPISKEKIKQLAEVWPRLTVQDKQKALKLILASDDYQVTHATLCYEPSPKQQAFHLAPNIGRAIFGGNQSGKTYAGTMEDAFHFTGEYPDWYPKELRLPTPNVGRILVKDFPKAVGEVLEPALMRSIHPRFVASAKRNSQGFLTKLIGHNNSRIDIVTHEMDTMSQEGWQGDWFHMDEPAPRDKFIANTRGLIRRKGRWWLTCTPLTEPWMYDEIFANNKVFHVVIDIRDNPYLSEEAIDEFLSRLTEDEREAREHGKFMHLSGLVYKRFEVGVHVRPSTTMIPPDWPRWRVVDPHDRRPFFNLWGAVDPLNRIWFYKEWPVWLGNAGEFTKMTSSNKGPKDYVHLWREMEMGETIFRRIMDSRFGKQPKMQIEGTEMGSKPNLFDIMDELGETFEPSYWTQSLGISDPGHQKVSDMLEVSVVTQEPQLFVLENCKNLIYAFQHNVWHKDTEKQGQFAKDPLDCVRMMVMDEPKYFTPPEKDFGRSRWAKPNFGNQGTYGSEVNI